MLRGRRLGVLHRTKITTISCIWRINITLPWSFTHITQKLTGYQYYFYTWLLYMVFNTWFAVAKLWRMVKIQVYECKLLELLISIKPLTDDRRNWDDESNYYMLVNFLCTLFLFVCSIKCILCCRQIEKVCRKSQQAYSIDIHRFNSDGRELKG